MSESERSGVVDLIVGPFSFSFSRRVWYGEYEFFSSWLCSIFFGYDE